MNFQSNETIRQKFYNPTSTLQRFYNNLFFILIFDIGFLPFIRHMIDKHVYIENIFYQTHVKFLYILFVADGLQSKNIFQLYAVVIYRLANTLNHVVLSIHEIRGKIIVFVLFEIFEFSINFAMLHSLSKNLKMDFNDYFTVNMGVGQNKRGKYKIIRKFKCRYKLIRQGKNFFLL